MLRKLFALFALLCVASAAPASAQNGAQPSSPSQISIADFLRAASIHNARLSPNGRYVVAIQRVAQGDALVVIDWRTRAAQAIQVARRDLSLSLGWVDWKNDDRLIFSLRQHALSLDNGAVNTYDVSRVFAVDRDGSHVTQMFEGQINRLAWRDAPIGVIDTLPHDPDHVLLGTWGQRGFTLYRADINSGAVQAVEDADWDTNRMIVDVSGHAIMRQDILPRGSGIKIYRRGSTERGWTLAYEARHSAQLGENREFYPITAGPAPGQVYVAARPADADFQAIYLYDTATGDLGQPVFANPHADVGVGWFDDDNNIVIGCASAERIDCRATDRHMQRHFDALNAFFEGKGNIRLVDMSGDLWMLFVSGPTMPGSYYVYDKSNAQITPLAAQNPALAGANLAPVDVVRYTGRDGTPLFGYVTAQPGSGTRPLVVLPHGGPELRDYYDYDFLAQFLASRGYVVLQPNFRGSEGFGRAFAFAGRGQWGRAMQNDISDGVQHLIETGVADRNKICIVGASYGGYATLAGMTLTPELYRCGISMAGVSDLPQMLSWERREHSRGTGLYDYFVDLIGDPTRDRDNLIAVSPARQAANVRAPILLIHGTGDQIVPSEQSEIMNRALRAAGKDVRYVEIEGEDHGWDGWSDEHMTQLLTEVQTFLDANIGPNAPAQATAP